ncbi:MAG: carboxypeptidase regulatory-like domain-containing protein [Acidobacteria bacterium]|nr:MAG: carboxypeptidase regulatory-like domain-containing protein [Acidobacteriota bacterium]
MSARIRLALVLVALVAAAPSVFAYLSLGTTVNGRSVQTRWTSMPIRYFITNRGVAGVSAAQMQAAAVASFSTWSQVPTASLSASFAGFTNAEPVRDDGATVIGFQPHEELERTLGVTAFTLDRTTGTLVEADIYLNSAFDWSVAASGEANKFDVQSTLTHEIGHLLGLGHSLLGETVLRPEGGRRVTSKRSVMFPIAYLVGTTLDRTLQDDDIAGVSDTYPTGKFLNSTGSVAGRVTLDGAGVFGAHVIAVNTKTGQTVGAFTLNSQGQFTMDGLEPGIYVLRVEPIDDADVGSFFNDDAKVDVNFRAAFYSKLVAVPVGGAGASAEIKVVRK